MNYSAADLSAEIRAASNSLDTASESARKIKIDDLRTAINSLPAQGIGGVNELEELVRRANESIGLASQSLREGRQALADYEDIHIVNGGGRVTPRASAGGLGAAATAVLAAVTAAGGARAKQLGAHVNRVVDETGDPDTRSELTAQFEQARAESLERNGDVRSARRRLLALFAAALRRFLEKHSSKLDGLFKIAGVAVSGAALLVALGLITAGPGVALISVAPFYIAAAKFARQMLEFGSEHGFRHNGKTYLMVGKEALKVALAAHGAQLIPLTIAGVPLPDAVISGVKLGMKGAVAAGDYTWKMIELHSKRRFQAGGKTFYTATKETISAAFEVVGLSNESISFMVADKAREAFFTIIENRPAGGIWWNKKEFLKMASREVIKSSIGAFLSSAVIGEKRRAQQECRIENVFFEHVEQTWKFTGETVPDAHAFFLEKSRAYAVMARYVRNRWP